MDKQKQPLVIKSDDLITTASIRKDGYFTIEQNGELIQLTPNETRSIIKWLDECVNDIQP